VVFQPLPVYRKDSGMQLHEHLEVCVLAVFRCNQDQIELLRAMHQPVSLIDAIKREYQG